MKKALRIIVPILLILAVLACTTWYLMIYDRDFTRDVLLQQARVFENMGHHKVATWLYDVAYYQSSYNDSVAIELAQQYVSDGNYTKAEYTLSNAISDNSSAELYMALCNIYVQQDKLLDAVNLLDTIADANIKAAVDAQRPQAPVLTPDSGFYSQYISVTAQAEGTVYLSTDGEYPSTVEDLYTDSVTMPAGETIVQAIAVDDNLLVSPLSAYGYTIGGVVEQVTFADAAMEEAIRAVLGVGENKMLYTNDLWVITEFTVPSDVQNYDDLGLLTYVTSLTLTGVSNADLSCLGSMTSLQELSLSDCAVSEDALTAIGKLTGLRRLTMNNCGLTSIAPLESLTKLKYLSLSGNTLRNLSAIAAMTELQELDLSSNAVTELGALTGLNLSKLDISHNSVGSLQPIFSNASLTELTAAHNQLTEITGIAGLQALVKLDLSNNSLVDANYIALCKALQELNLSANALTEIGALSALEELTSLNFSKNEITDLPAFTKESKLVTIDGSYNKLENLDALAGLQYLNNVFMDYNEELKVLNPLNSCPLLVLVNVYGTKVQNVSFLLEKSIIVNYNPTGN